MGGSELWHLGGALVLSAPVSEGRNRKETKPQQEDEFALCSLTSSCARFLRSEATEYRCALSSGQLLSNDFVATSSRRSNALWERCAATGETFVLLSARGLQSGRGTSKTGDTKAANARKRFF